MFITELAYFCLLLAFVLAIFQFVLPMYGIFVSRENIQALAPSFAISQFLALLIAFFGLMAGFYYNDFSLIYITQHSNSLLPWYYKLSATWAGHEGSLLLWVTILSGWAFSVVIFGRSLPKSILAKILVVLASIQSMMLLMLITSSSPFERSLFNNRISLPVDGADLNPLLQDFGLIIHPPLLYMGYVGMAVPFAFCVAALWESRMDSTWARWSIPWALSAWGFLTIGITLGSWWAYYELGWGGWWFWDPVENASLMPWLVCTALIHSLVATEKRGVFKAWTIMLAIFSFALSLLGTFLVRSGIIASVHSFASDPTRGMLILIILTAIIGASLLLFAFRGWKLTVESNYQLKSRETFIVINNIILLIATLVVMLGTLYPIIANAMNWGQVSVGTPYFNKLFVPLTWLVLLIMGVGGAIRWKRDKRPFLGVSVIILLSSATLASILIFFINPNKLLNLTITFTLCIWVLGWSIYDIKEKTKNSNKLHKLKKLTASYWGMQLAHIGVLVCSIGIAITTSQSIEKDVSMNVGDSIKIDQYKFTMNKLYPIQAKNYDGIASEIIIYQDNKEVARLYPEKRNYIISMMPMTESAIDASLWRDLYVALGEPIFKDQASSRPSNQLIFDASLQNEKWAVRIYIKPFIRWIWFGALLMTLGSIIALVDRRYRF